MRGRGAVLGPVRRTSWRRRRLAAVLAVASLVCQVCRAADGASPAWPTCENREHRDDDIEPGGLRLLGVQESPLGDFPGVPAPATHEHLFQQLREVWTDDCPRLCVQVGLQPSPGEYRTWSAAALWLHYFNSSGTVVAVDAVDHFLEHFEASLRAGPHGPLLGFPEDESSSSASTEQVRVQTVKALLTDRAQGKKSKEQPVSFNDRSSAAEQVLEACAAARAGPEAEDERHPCARVLRAARAAEPLEYLAPAMTFDEIWKRKLRSRHVDYLRVDVGGTNMVSLLKKGFSAFFSARQASVFSFRVDEAWTKADLKEVVEWLDRFEYFSMFVLLCGDSSQAGSFSYYGPGGDNVGPTTYLPISGIEFDRTVDWDRMPLPQDVVAFDLHQPDIFRTVQLGDASCDADDAGEETCPSDGSGSCRAGSSAVPGAPEQLRVVRAEPRALTLEWRAHPNGPLPVAYTMRVDPGAMEDSIEHDGFDMSSGVQMYTINNLRPATEYTIRLRSEGPGGESDDSVVRARTDDEEVLAAGELYDIAEDLHCGMASADEVQPAGPPPQGTSFFRDVTDTSGCRARCDDSRQCVAFQVKGGDACWLYRRRPRDGHLSGPRRDDGWWCGVKREG